MPQTQHFGQATESQEVPSVEIATPSNNVSAYLLTLIPLPLALATLLYDLWLGTVADSYIDWSCVWNELSWPVHQPTSQPGDYQRGLHAEDEP
jgi:hypothetical protein